MSNDLLAAMWATLALWLGLRGPRPRWAAGVGLALGLAVLTKASTATLAPVVAVAHPAPCRILVSRSPCPLSLASDASRDWPGIDRSRD